LTPEKRLFEIALELVRLDHDASVIVKRESQRHFVVAVWSAKKAESSARLHNEAQRCFIYRVADRRRITR
jgi:hypothetical protein